MRIILATLATPTFVNELYEHSLVDLAEMYEIRAFTNHDKAIEWANAQIEERNAEIAEENAKYEDTTAQYKLYEDRNSEHGTRELLWTEEGDAENTTPDQMYVLVMKEQDLNAE